MMKEFDLNDFGKQMPYHVPEGFFVRFPEQVMRKVAVERRRRRMWRLSVGMTAVAALVAGIVFWTGTPEAIPSVPSGDYADRMVTLAEQLDAYLDHLSDEELAEQYDYYAADVTLTLYEE